MVKELSNSTLSETGNSSASSDWSNRPNARRQRVNIPLLIKNLNNEIQNNTGAISFLTTPYHDKNNESRFQFVCYFSALGNKLNDANELVSDILFNTIFTDYKRLKELISEVELW